MSRTLGSDQRLWGSLGLGGHSYLPISRQLTWAKRIIFTVTLLYRHVDLLLRYPHPKTPSPVGSHGGMAMRRGRRCHAVNKCPMPASPDTRGLGHNPLGLYDDVGCHRRPIPR